MQLKRTSPIVVILLVCLFPALARAGGPKVQLERDGGGTAHVTAPGWHGLGYGTGFGFAQDNLCVLANEFVTVQAQRSRYFGPDERSINLLTGADDSNLDSDFFYQRLKDERVVQKLLAKDPPLGPAPPLHRLIAGWADGYNAYLRSERFDDPNCAGEPWVRPIAAIDVWRRVYQLVISASGGRFITDQVAATPPSAGVAAAGETDIEPEALREAIGEVPDPASGSNILGVGADAMRSGRSMLVANSHLPWSGASRLWDNHQKIPGKFNVWGASFFGSPIINEGYNGEIAWGHSDDTTRRFVFMQLDLDPGDPTSYRLGGEYRAMKPETVTVKAQGPGDLEERSHTFYETRYGLVSNLADAGYAWSEETAYALIDSNAGNLRAANTWLKLGRADNLREIEKALTSTLGAPWVNTVAVDRSGRTFYGDIGPVANVDAAKIDDCTPPGLPTLAYLTARLITLDGSEPTCAPGDDPEAIVGGILGPDEMPTLTRRDFVVNSNDSYWLANADQPIEGFSPIIGTERTPQSLRTRGVQLQVRDRIDGGDGLGQPGFNVPSAERMVLSNRSYGAAVTRDRLVALCEANPILTASNAASVDVSEACPILADYDLTGNLDAKGGWLYAEWWRRTAGTAAGFWEDPFDPDNPLTTPNVLRNGVASQQATALADAVQSLRANGIALDVSFGDVQHTTRNGERIPIHGCRMGCLNTIWAANGGPGDVGDYGEVQFGSSAILTIKLNRRGATGSSTSAYSQATDPTSPWYENGSREFSRKEWRPMLFTPKQIASDPDLRSRTLRPR